MKSKPLDGLRVLDFSRLYAGPFCAMQLGDLGADVVKVEIPGGDPCRHQGPPFHHSQSMSFLCCNRNKRSIVIDLKTQDGLETARRLARAADVIVENFRPDVMHRMGLDYETISHINPRVVFASLSGFGPDGVYSDRGAFDITVQAEFGYMSITGEKGGKPIKQGTSIFDLVCGLYGFNGIMSALFQRERTGVGQWIQTSLMEAEISFLVDAAMEYFVTGNIRGRWGSEHSNIVPYKVFETADGEMVIAAGYQNLFERFVEALGLEHLLEDKRFAQHSDRIKNRDAFYALLDPEIRKRNTKDLYRQLDDAGVPCAPVNNMQQVFTHPQVLHRKMVTQIAHDTRGPVPTIGPAIKYSAFEITEGWTAPPALDEHSDQVLKDWLGIVKAEAAISS